MRGAPRAWLPKAPGLAICACALAWLAGTAALPATAAQGAPAPSAPRLSVRAAALIEASTGQELFGLDAHRRLAIASATKLMTSLVTLEHAHLGRLFTAPDYHLPAVYSQLGLTRGERMTVRDLLIALLLPSADDAAEDLAYNVGRGSVVRFVGLMNARAQSLGLRETHYSTPIGLDTPGNYSSAHDLVTLARYLLRVSPFLRRVVAMPSATLTSGASVRHVSNLNLLVSRVPWINGVKTGHTIDAGYVLVGSGTRHGMTLISAVLGTDGPDARDSNTLALLDYGFRNFHLLRVIRAGEVLGHPTVRDQPGLHPDVIAPTPFRGVFARTAHVSVQVQVPRQLRGPLRARAIVGSATVIADGRPVAHVRLVVRRAVPAVSALTRLSRFLVKPRTLVAIAVALCAIAGAAMFLRGRARTTGTRSPA